MSNRKKRNALQAVPSGRLIAPAGAYSPSSERMYRLAMLALLFIAVCFVYGRGLHSPFVFDDHTSVLENPTIMRLWPLVGNAQNPGPLSPPRDTPTGGRPLVNLSFALNFAIGGVDPMGYRVVNILLHVCSAMLLGAIVRRTLRLDVFGGQFAGAAWPVSVVVALLWALHPLTTEAVMYVTQRTELMVGLFYLAMLYSSLRYWTAEYPLPSGEGRVRETTAVDSPSPQPSPGGRGSGSGATWLVVATLACLAGMASKEVMVSAPIVVLLMERAFVAGSFRGALRQSWPLYVGLSVGWMLLLALNVGGPRGSSVGFAAEVPAYVWWLTQAKVVLMYLKLVVWPWPLSIHYGGLFVDSFATGLPWLIVTGLLLGSSILLLVRNSPSGFLAAAFWIILAPTSIVPIVQEAAAERRMYLSLAALVALAVVGGYWLLARRYSEALRAVVIAGSALSATYGLVSFVRVGAYANEAALWLDAAEARSNDPIVRYGLGSVLLGEGKTQEAIEQLREARRLKPDYLEAYNALGVALARLGKSQEAIDTLQQALRLKPDYAAAHNNLASVFVELGRTQEAIDEYRAAVRSKPDYIEAQINLADVLGKVGRIEEAITAYQVALRIRPDSDAAHNGLAVLLLNAGRPRDAIEHLEAAIRAAPRNPQRHCNLGTALLSAGRSTDAAARFEEALRLKADYVDAWANLAVAHAALNRRSEAIAAAGRALELARAQGQTQSAQQIDAWLTAYRGP